MDVRVVRKLIGLIVGLAVLLPLILLMFIGPASRGTPHDLPIGVAGQGRAAKDVAARIAERDPGAFEVRVYDDGAALAAAAERREIYGGLILDAAPHVVIATGAGPTAAAVVQGIGTGVLGPRVRVVDVAPAAADDPRGAGFGAMLVPVFISAAALGIAGAQLGRRVPVIAVLVPIGGFTIAAGCVGVAMAVGVLTGGFAVQWLVMGLGITAIAAVIGGLIGILGMAGMGVAALVFMIVGFPLAGFAAPPDFLPAFWGGLGQWLPLGATGTALRSASFFPDSFAGTGAAYGALALWIAVGYLLLGATVLRRRRIVDEVLAHNAAVAAG